MPLVRAQLRCVSHFTLSFPVASDHSPECPLRQGARYLPLYPCQTAAGSVPSLRQLSLYPFFTSSSPFRRLLLFFSLFRYLTFDDNEVPVRSRTLDTSSRCLVIIDFVDFQIPVDVFDVYLPSPFVCPVYEKSSNLPRRKFIRLQLLCDS